MTIAFPMSVLCLLIGWFSRLYWRAYVMYIRFLEGL